MSMSVVHPWPLHATAGTGTAVHMWQFARPALLVFFFAATTSAVTIDSITTSYTKDGYVFVQVADKDKPDIVGWGEASYDNEHTDVVRWHPMGCR